MSCETFVYLCMAFFIAMMIAGVVLPIANTLSVKAKIRRLSREAIEITPKQFFKIRNRSNGGRGRQLISNKYAFAGVYILYNHTKDLYYVGQAKNVFSRVNSHFTGHGNGDVYADYKYGDEFTIKMIELKGSGFKTLNELERSAIKTYNAYAKGYNKTRGNRG